MRDLPCFEFQDHGGDRGLSSVCCPDYGIKIEKVPQLPSAVAPFCRRFEDAVKSGVRVRSAAARPVARRFGLPASTVRAIDLRYLQPLSAARRKPALALMGVDEIHLGKKQKFITVVSNLESGEPVWFGRERKKETLDEFFQTELSAVQRRQNLRRRAWVYGNPFRLSIEQWAPQCTASSTTSSTWHAGTPTRLSMKCGRVEFFRKGGQWRGLVKGSGGCC